ncbi:MAG: hypothetical protein L3K07_03395 [Thermoplasmata archaeon]|nr:hypothetical protein [Thermoplasmata archaeon]
MRNGREKGSLLGAIRLLRVTGWVILLALASYLALAGYSAVTLTPNGTGSAEYALLPDGTVTILTTLNLTNPGLFAFTKLSVTSQIMLPNGTGAWLESTSPSITLPAQGVAQVPLRFSLTLSSLGLGKALLTQDEVLNESDYLNGTYATFVGFVLHAGEHLDWGAPFHDFQASAGTPVPEGNGTYGVPVKLSFGNDASFGVEGTVHASLESAGGAVCADANFPINDPPHSTTQESVTLYVPTGCSLAGGMLASRFMAPGFVVPLPPQALP